MTTTRIVIFAKAPVPGAVKTRLIPALGARRAAELAKWMLAKTVASAFRAGLGPFEVCVTPPPDDPRWSGHLPKGVCLTDQGPGDLGQRLGRAAKRVIAAGESLLLIGTDCPSLDGSRLRAMAVQLSSHDAVIYPAEDGGYVLLGLNRFHASLFNDMPWSGPEVAAVTCARIEALSWRLFIGDTMSDIDEPADLSAMKFASNGWEH